MTLAITCVHNLPPHLSYVSTLPDITQKLKHHIDELKHWHLGQHSSRHHRQSHWPVHVKQRDITFIIIIIYLFSKMKKYSWIKQENTEQGEPGSYERLYGSLYMHTVWAILYSENVGTHTKTLNIKNTTLRKLEKSTFWMDHRNLGSELKSTTLSGREFQVFMMRSLKNAALKREALCFLTIYIDGL